MGTRWARAVCGALVLAVLLVGPTAIASDRLWGGVYALGDPATAGEAEKSLKAAGERGVERLIQAARAGAEYGILNEALERVGCKDQRASGTKPIDLMIPRRAAALAASWLPEYPRLQEKLLGSQDELERALAVLSLIRSPKKLLAEVGELQVNHLPIRRALISSLNHCVLTRKDLFPPGIQDALKRRLNDLNSKAFYAGILKPKGCLTTELAEGMVAGTAMPVVFQGAGQNLVLAFQRADRMRVHVAGSCVLDIYQVARQRGPVKSWLLTAFISMSKDQDLRRRAADLLVRDLDQLEAKERDRAAAALVNAGFDVPQKISTGSVGKGYGRIKSERHEAALRQGSPEAQVAVDELLACPTAGKRVALLGFAVGGDQARAAELAWDLAGRCPQLAGYSAAALIRLGDPRAVQALEMAWEEMEWWAIKDLSRALLERSSPEAQAEVARQAATGDKRATRLQRILEVNGLAGK